MENQLKKLLVPMLDRLNDISAELDHFHQIEGLSVGERNRLKAMYLNVNGVKAKVLKALQVIGQQG